MRSETKSVSEANRTDHVSEGNQNYYKMNTTITSGKYIVMEETNSVSGNNPPLHSDPLLGPAGVESC